MRRSLLLAPLLALCALAVAAWAFGPRAAAQEPAGRAGQPIVIRWSTETEVNTAGFNVYRALSEDGPWEKINPRLVPASPDPLRGGSYVFTDTNVIAGVTYWYELEEIELSGRATPLERTSATARAPGLAIFGNLPCGGGASLFMLLGLAGVLARRRGRDYGAA